LYRPYERDIDHYRKTKNRTLHFTGQFPHGNQPEYPWDNYLSYRVEGASYPVVPIAGAYIGDLFPVAVCQVGFHFFGTHFHEKELTRPHFNLVIYETKNYFGHSDPVHSDG
jgi:hypothetical protein